MLALSRKKSSKALIEGACLGVVTKIVVPQPFEGYNNNELKREVPYVYNRDTYSQPR